MGANQQMLVASSGYALPLVCDSADFDGANDYMLRGAGLTGVADGKKGLVSAWVRLDGGDGSNLYILYGHVTTFECLRGTSNTFSVRGRSTSATILSLRSGSHTSGAAWLHILSSWDLGTGGASHLYINDVSDCTVVTFTDDILDYAMSSPNWGAGAADDGSAKMNGCLAEVYFDPTTYLDLSVTANRRKFITSTGKPANLGIDGSTPTGIIPAVYFHLDHGETAANFSTNRGAGGDFTITGSLTTGSTSPSD